MGPRNKYFLEQSMPYNTVMAVFLYAPIFQAFAASVRSEIIQLRY